MNAQTMTSSHEFSSPIKRALKILFVALCAFVSLFVIQPLHALDTLNVTSPNPLLESWRWTDLNAPDGALGNISDIEEDRDGNIWFGSSSTGLHKYDGYHWTHPTLPESMLEGNLLYVNDITHDHAGNTWVALWGQGIARFNGKTWTLYTTNDGLVNLGLVSIKAMHSGDIYAGHWGGGLSRFDGTIWTSVTTPIEPSQFRAGTMEETSDGILYFGSRGHGVLRFDPKSSAQSAWTQYTTAQGLAHNVVYDILATRDGSLWAITKGGLSRFDGTKWHTESAQKGLPKDQLYIGLWQTANGILWTNIPKLGLCYFDGTKWQIHARDTLPSVSQGYPTRNGAIWFTRARTENGVYRFDPTEQWKTYTLPDNLNGGYGTPDGSVWFTNRKTPVRFYNNQWLAYGPEDGAPDSTAALFQTRNGDLWFTGTHKGEAAIAQYSDHTWKIFTLSDGLIDRPGGMVETQNGDLWFTGSHNGRAAVLRFNGSMWQRFTEGLKGEQTARSFEASDGTLWFGTRRTSENGRIADGVIRYNPSAASIPSEVEGFRTGSKTWTQYTSEDSLGNTWGFAEWPKGTLWVGATLGISWVDLNTLPDRANWKRKTNDDFGVFLPKIGALTPTNDALYFRFFPPRNKGVVRYDGKTWHRITQRNGLAHASVGDILKTTSGTLYFAAQGGLTRFDGKHWTHYIDEYKSIAGPEALYTLREMKDGSIWILSGSKALHFKPNDNLTTPETTLAPAPDLVSSAGNIPMHWTGADKWSRTASRDMQYEYRLNGNQWISTANTSGHTFTELSDGAHRVEVRTINRYGIVDPTPAIQTFTVESPWWKNPYVLGLGFILISLTTLQTTRLIRRDRRLRETNHALSDANNELYTLNKDLQDTNQALEEANEEIQTATQLKSRFLATMSHELRTPMNAIIGFTRLVLRRSDRLEERQSDNLTKVLQSADHLLNLINDILDLSKIEADHMDIRPEPFNVKNLITSCCATVTPLVRDTVELTYNIDEAIGDANTDEARLRQVMINLLSNALKFTEKGGVKVDVRIQNTEYRIQEEVNGKSQKQMLAIAVSDTGVGIPEDQLEIIFDEFRQVDGSSTRKVQGTGLGLSICRKLSELMGGTIEVASEVGKGSVFTVRIPVAYQDET